MEVRGSVWKKGREKVQITPGMSRWQQKIEGLDRERRQLRKQWKRAEQSQEELNLLQRAIKDKLATLSRAECLRKHYKKKESAGAKFYFILFYSFKFVKKLFTSERNGIHLVLWEVLPIWPNLSSLTIL